MKIKDKSGKVHLSFPHPLKLINDRELILCKRNEIKKNNAYHSAFYFSTTWFKTKKLDQFNFS